MKELVGKTLNKLPTPIGKQREVLYLPAEGHTVVLGTAGSGKTTLAILRSAYLADPSTDHNGGTLLVTLNKALVTFLCHLKPPEFRNVVVENYHKFARGYLNSRGKMGKNDILSNAVRRATLIQQAVENVKEKYDPHQFFKRPLQMFSEEIRWILNHGISNKDDYKNAERIGRASSRIHKNLRNSMFEIFEEYLSIRSKTGKSYDWDDLAFHVNQELKRDTSGRYYRHIVIDEGQDFSPEMLRSLAMAIPSNGSLTFFGDVAQQIYGQRMSWRSAGLNTQKIWEFKDNYRNTKEIARLGLAISKMPYFSGIPDLVEPSAPSAAGELPTLVKCKNKEEEIELAVKLANANSSNQNVAILFKNRDYEGSIKDKIPPESIRLHREMTTWQAEPGIRYGTYHAAKGLEFDMVIIPFLSQDNLPDQGNIESFGRKDALTLDGRLLYVAVTRAKTRLVLTYSGKRTELLPTGTRLYKEVST